MAHDHDDHDHDHDHDNRYTDMQARVKALETALTEKGLIDPAAIDAIVEAYETRIGPRNGAHVVAKAWIDPAFADWLKRDATAAIAIQTTELVIDISTVTPLMVKTGP